MHPTVLFILSSQAKAGKGKGKGKTQEPSITAVGGGTFASGDPVTVRKPNDVESEVVRGALRPRSRPPHFSISFDTDFPIFLKHLRPTLYLIKIIFFVAQE